MRIDTAMALYLRHLTALGRSPYTIKGAKYGLKSLSSFLEQARTFDIEDLDRELLCDYQQELAFRITAKGAPLGRAAREKLINVAQGFTRFLKQRQYLLGDPGETLTPPKRGRRLPRSILSLAEVEQLLNGPDRRTHRGRRDRQTLNE